MNDSGTSNDIGAKTVPDIRTLAELRSFLHGYRIKASGKLPRSARASIIIEAIDTLANDPLPDTAALLQLHMQRAARELAELDPSMAWLPDWKPRVAVKGGTE